MRQQEVENGELSTRTRCPTTLDFITTTRSGGKKHRI